VSLGNFDFEQLRILYPVVSPMVFLLFVVLSVFIMLNMFIAIITDAFQVTKQRVLMEEEKVMHARLHAG
jgi:hypothetical protein